MSLIRPAAELQFLWGQSKGEKRDQQTEGERRGPEREMDRDDDPVEGARDRQRTEPDLGDEDPEGDDRKEDEAKFRAVPKKGQEHGQEDGEAGYGGDEAVGVLESAPRGFGIRHDGTGSQPAVHARGP